ncbi:MAG: sodium/proton-translocating pyrophosphatase, partial [Ktedonobacterales bacterium]
MDNTLWWLALPVGASVIAILFAFGLRRWVLANDTGTPAMRKVSDAIYEGAQAFLSRQYRTIAVLAVVSAVVIGIILAIIANYQGGGDPWWVVGIRTGLSFLFGAFCSGLAGYIGMQV